MRFLSQRAPGGRRTRDTWIVAGIATLVAATAGIAISTATGLAASGQDAARQTHSAERAQNPLGFPQNGAGETYGSDIEASNLAETPDLIAATGNNGVRGYIKKSEIYPRFRTPEEALAWQAENGKRPQIIEVYAQDGVTPVDTFTIVPGRGYSGEVVPDEAKGN